MLGDAHRPRAHGAVRGQVHLRGFFDLRAGEPGLILNLLPARGTHARAIFRERVRVLRDELAIQQ